MNLPRLLVLNVGVLTAIAAVPQFIPHSEAASALVSAAQTAEESDPLGKILHTMDETAPGFRSAQAEFVWTTYNSVINDVAEKDTGKIYFRRTGKGTEMAAEVAPPARKQIIF